MAQSYVHAQASARHFKAGKPEDYLPIHEWIDQMKESFGDVRHRAFFHNTKGPWLCQDVFGHFIEVEPWDKPGTLKKVLVREIAENHIVEDLGCIPSPGDWLDCMNCRSTHRSMFFKYSDNPDKSLLSVLDPFDLVLCSGSHYVFLQESFGDHAVVIATRGGFNVEFFDHD